MTIEHIVFLLEELSAKKMLDVIVPKILPPEITFQCICFQGKTDLMNNVALKIRAWKRPNSVFLVMRDQDNGDCNQIKRLILDECKKAYRKPDEYLVRIACHELEAFYLGDLNAVRSAGFKVKKQRKKITNPDTITYAAEELSRLTDKKYQKVQGSAAIAPFLKLDGSNKSVSFNMLISGIKKLANIP